MNGRLNRREFLLLSLTAGAGIALAPHGHYRFAQGTIGANDRVKVGIIGLGHNGRRHLAEYLNLPNVSVAAICDVDESKLRLISEEMFRAGLARPFLTTDYRRLLDLGEIDVLSVATPKKRRVEIGIAACEAGKHLMIEKPFSASIDEGKQLVTWATKTKRFAQQRESLAFAPLAEISSLTRSIRVGEIRAVRSWKKVRMEGEIPGRGNQRNFKSREVSYDELIEYALDELDIARCLMEVESPINVTTAYFSGNDSRTLPAGVAVQFDFDKGGMKKRSLNFELKFDVSKTSNSSPTNYQENFESKSVYLTSHGELSIECNSDFEGFNSENNSWENLVSCIRADNLAGLQNPISEAQKSCNLIHLAAESLQMNYPRSFAN